MPYQKKKMFVIKHLLFKNKLYNDMVQVKNSRLFVGDIFVLWERVYITDVYVGSGSQQQFDTITLVMQAAVVQRSVSRWRLYVHIGAGKKRKPMQVNMQVWTSPLSRA